MGEIPDFITGTPIIVVGEEGFCGDAAFQWVEQQKQQAQQLQQPQSQTQPQPQPQHQGFSETGITATRIDDVPFDPSQIMRDAEKDPRYSMNLEEAMRNIRK